MGQIITTQILLQSKKSGTPDNKVQKNCIIWVTFDTVYMLCISSNVSSMLVIVQYYV